MRKIVRKIVWTFGCIMMYLLGGFVGLISYLAVLLFVPIELMYFTVQCENLKTWKEVWGEYWHNEWKVLKRLPYRSINVFFED